MTLRFLGSSGVFGTLLVGAALMASSCNAGSSGNPLNPSPGIGAGTATTEAKPMPTPSPTPTPTPNPVPAPTPPSPGPGPDPMPTPTPTPNPNPPGPTPTPTPTPPIDERLREVLHLSIQDEYRARYTYEKVLLDFGDLTPFSRIVQAEAKHIEAVSRLFANRGLTVPASTWSIGSVPTFLSFTAACEGGVAAEIANYQMYEGFLAELQQVGALPQDVSNVFNSLMEASRDQHLPAFEACAAR